MAKIRLKKPGPLIAGLMRFIGSTLDVRLHNLAEVDSQSPEKFIWAFWHDSIFLMPWLWETIFPTRKAVILTSPSKDGDIIEQTCAQFRLDAARGSSSRRGAEAMIILAKHAKAGYDIGITPDGPRGPRHQLNAGVIKLAQLTGLSIVPIHVHYHKAYAFDTWDRFQLPLPFSRVDIEFRDRILIPRDSSEEFCEEMRVYTQSCL